MDEETGALYLNDSGNYIPDRNFLSIPDLLRVGAGTETRPRYPERTLSLVAVAAPPVGKAPEAFPGLKLRSGRRKCERRPIARLETRSPARSSFWRL